MITGPIQLPSRTNAPTRSNLAYNVGLPTPSLPEAAVDSVVELLTRLAMRRHRSRAILRALTRAERAPATITAF